MIEIVIDGVVGEAPNTATDVRAALRAGGPVTVSVNSPGGVATEGLAIYNVLKAHAGRVDVVVDSIAASAASLIAMAGDSIAMRDGAMIMIHDPSAVTVGTAADHQKSAAVLVQDRRAVRVDLQPALRPARRARAPDDGRRDVAGCEPGGRARLRDGGFR